MSQTEYIYVKEKIRKKIKHTLDKRRYEHTLGVAYTAAALAMRYEENIESAELAGLLHDCAKYMTGEEMLQACEESHIEINAVEHQNLFLLHAKLGAYMAQAVYGVDEPEILSAIKWHTTGHPNMTMLEKIVFIADYIEPNRLQAPNLKQIRHLAFTDIDAAMRAILRDTLEYLDSIHGEIDGMTEETYHYYLSVKPESEKTCVSIDAVSQTNQSMSK